MSALHPIPGVTETAPGSGEYYVNVDAPPPEVAAVDRHVPAPKPDDAMLYGIAGEIGRAAAKTTEANPYATAMAYLTFLSANCGRDVYLPIGNTRHHARINALQVGRTSVGRKGEALSLPHRMRREIERDNDHPLGQTHTGGLSTREGLALLIHDGLAQGKEEMLPVEDKRLWIVESEFANVLHQSRRDGNTLSAALRDAWDGVSIRPAIKTSRVWASDPHIAISAAITPAELLDLMKSRELTNGFANRFVIFWAERTKLVPFPTPTPDDVVSDLVSRTRQIVKFAKGSYPASKDGRKASLTPAAATLYQDAYLNKLNASTGSVVVDAVLERRAPTLLRLALLFAITDKTLMIEPKHIKAALAWVRYWAASVRFIFSKLNDERASEKAHDMGRKILAYIEQHGEVSRSDLYSKCFRNHEQAKDLDAALDALLAESPSRLALDERPRPKGASGAKTKIYRLVQRPSAYCAYSAECGSTPGVEPMRNVAEHCVMSDEAHEGGGHITHITQDYADAETRVTSHITHNTHITHAPLEETAADDVEVEL